MNPTTDQPPLLHQQQQQPRSSFSCDRHPNESFNGFCGLCLCERLTILDNNNINNHSSNSTSSAIKSIFNNKLSLVATNNNNTKTTSFFPELRRTKSVSATRNAEFFNSGFEPPRKSCDVRSSLFSVEKNDFKHLSINDNTVIHVDSEIRNIIDEIADIEQEIAQEIEGKNSEEELKTMNDHIHVDLDSNSKKSNFWSAASVLSKKWQNWRRKQKKIPENDVAFPANKMPVSRQYRETQSEMADNGFGRRSCDVDPRFSLNAGRYSFDEPRASWDGYMIGRTFPRLPPMVENVPVPRSDMQISVEEDVLVKKDAFVPGGSLQTKEYYTDSSSKRRKSLDRSNSIRKMAVAEMDQTKEKTVTSATANVSNAKVTPATIDYGYPNNSKTRLRFPSIGGERELGMDSNSLRDDCLELGLNNLGEKNQGKKPRQWRWKLWGFSRSVNGVERSYSGSWQERGINKKVFRSNSSVSWRNSSNKSSSEINGFGNGNNRRIGGNEFVLERNPSARGYSPKHTDSGLLRFYLTPLRRSRSTNSNSNSVGKNKLRPYRRWKLMD